MAASLHTAGASSSTPSEYTDAFELAIPTPALAQSFRLACDLEPVRSLGEGLHGDGGQFNWINFTGGYISGSFGTGVILPGGQDSQHVLAPSHPSAPSSAQLSTRYLIRVDSGPHHPVGSEPTYVQLSTRGWRTGPPEVMARLAAAARVGFEGKVPEPSEYKFRLCVEMETDSRGPLAFLNTTMWVGSGVRKGRQVIYDGWEIV